MLDSARFRGLWSHFTSGDSTTVFDRLRTAYSEPHRAYHNAVHIAACLRQLDRVRDQAERPDELELAIWYHDVVYDTHAADNEERSAAFAVREMISAGIAVETAARVERLILVTKHDREPESADAALLLDIDLSILGRGQEEFDAYDRDIRTEYCWVPEGEYRDARAAILRRFLDRPVIFRTPAFRSFETPARRNLEVAIAKLTSLGARSASKG